MCNEINVFVMQSLVAHCKDATSSLYDRLFSLHTTHLTLVVAFKLCISGGDIYYLHKAKILIPAY